MAVQSLLEGLKGWHSHNSQGQLLFHGLIVLNVRKLLLISRLNFSLFSFHPLFLVWPSGALENSLTPPLCGSPSNIGALLSSVCEVQWEAEFFTLQDNNNKLVAALREANANVEQWKQQLAAYQEETEALRQRVAELETQRGHNSSSDIRKETCPALEELEQLVKAKDEVSSCIPGVSAAPLGQKRQNTELERRLHLAEQSLSETLSEREKMYQEVSKLAEIMDMKIFELSELRQDLAKLVESN
uniref:Homer scaffold protein 3 n=1 Tax=Pseudonaja textilis TaxID=8673 RepID=A0A670Y3D8_PSETE